MRIVVIYRPESEHGRRVEEFVRDYEGRHGAHGVELLNVDGREGGAMATLYDVMQYPAVLVLREDGQLLKSWEGSELPMMDEVAAYAYA